MSKEQRPDRVHNDNDLSDLLVSVGEEYAVCEPAPKHTHMLFDVVRSMQREFDEYRYGSLERLQLAAEPFVNSINKTMKQSGLLGVPVLLSGSGIRRPHADITLATNETTIAPRRQSASEDIESQYYDDETSGLFAGIWYQPRAVESTDEEMPSQYQIDLFYQVEVGGYRHLLGKSQLYASSPVEGTAIEYYDDMHLRFVREALEELLTVDSLEVAMLVNELNVTLAKPKKTARTIRTVATLVHDIHATGSLRPGDSDALLNLVTAYINPQGMYDVEVPDALAYEDTEKGRDVVLLGPADDGRPRYALQSSEIIFAQGYEQDKLDETVVNLNPKGILEPFFVFEDEKMIVHVPMRRVKKFKVLG